ncbi:MAG TPA: hypothetical protein VNO52_07250, partial [Methylomirabilota bacterium]|nr:hypothetical protein [Methylomirabilota bacterium]
MHSEQSRQFTVPAVLRPVSDASHNLGVMTRSRRRLASSASRATLAVACVGMLLGLRPLSAEDWPRFLGPRADGTSLETGLLDRWPTNGPPRLWHRDIGTGYSAPSVRSGLLVLHHRVGPEEVVEAMEAATGRTVWRHGYPSAFVDPYGYNNG